MMITFHLLYNFLFFLELVIASFFSFVLFSIYQFVFLCTHLPILVF